MCRVRQEERVQAARRLSMAPEDPTTPGDGALQEPFDKEEEDERDKDQVYFASGCVCWLASITY